VLPEPDCVVAVDIGGTKLAAAIVDRDGQLRYQRAAPTNSDNGAGQALERALELIAAVIADEEREGVRPKALGVSTKGLTREDGVQIAGDLPGWAELRIPARLRERFPGLPTLTVNDVKAGTFAETVWGELRGVANGLYINLGTGVAAGIVVGGELVEGAHGAAGEIGYVVPSLAALAARCPDEAPLEELIGGRGMASRASRQLGRSVTMAELVTLGDHDEEARALCEELLDEVALWIANLSIVLDPSKVVLGGGFIRSGRDLCQRVEDVLKRAAPFRPDVVPAFFGADSALVGAGALALRLVAAAAPEVAGISGEVRTGQQVLDRRSQRCSSDLP